MSLQEHIRKQGTWTTQSVIRHIPPSGVPDLVGPSLSSVPFPGHTLRLQLPQAPVPCCGLVFSHFWQFTCQNTYLRLSFFSRLSPLLIPGGPPATVKYTSGSRDSRGGNLAIPASRQTPVPAAAVPALNGPSLPIRFLRSTPRGYGHHRPHAFCGSFLVRSRQSSCYSSLFLFCRQVFFQVKAWDTPAGQQKPVPAAGVPDLDAPSLPSRWF